MPRSSAIVRNLGIYYTIYGKLSSIAQNEPHEELIAQKFLFQTHFSLHIQS